MWKHTYIIYAHGSAHILLRTRALLIYMKNRYLHDITQIQAYYVYTATPMPTTCIIYCFACFGVSSVSPMGGIYCQLVILLITVLLRIFGPSRSRCAILRALTDPNMAVFVTCKSICMVIGPATSNRFALLPVEPCSLVPCLNSGGGSKVLKQTRVIFNDPHATTWNHSRNGLVRCDIGTLIRHPSVEVGWE